MLRTAAAATALTLTLAAAAPPQPPPQPPAQPPIQPDPLRGPAVDDQDHRTLVRGGMTGGFPRVEGRPEAAAVELLDLDPATASKARAVVDARATDLAVLLVDEIDTVRRITDEMTAGDTQAARQTLLDLWERHEPGRPRAPLLDDLAEVLSEDQLAAARRLVNEYWDAWLAHETRADGGADPERRRRVQDRLAFELFQQEVREAYDISLRRYRDALEAIYTAVDPTPEQREAIRDLVIQHIKDTRLSATPEQRRAATRRIYDLLDPERQGKMFDYILRVALPG